MKKVLFIGPSFYNFKNEASLGHLKEKYWGLSKEAGVFVLALGSPFHIKKWGSDFYLLKCKIRFLFFGLFLASWICWRKKIDVIVAQSPLLEGFFASILAKMFKKELIIEVHGDWDAIFLTKKRKLKGLQKIMVRLFVGQSFKRVNKVRVVAGYLAEKARQFAPRAVYYNFPTYTNLNIFFNEKEIAFGKYILFVGVLYKIKGVEYLLETFNKIKNDFPDFELKIVGDGPETANLKKQAKDLGISERIEFLGKLGLEETKNIMKKCYCLCLPSLSEGLPRVIIEAMSLAKPVVASRVGGIPEIVRDRETGFLFEKENMDDLSEKLKKILADKELAKLMGEKGEQFAREHFSIDKYITNYLKMIKD